MRRSRVGFGGLCSIALAMVAGACGASEVVTNAGTSTSAPVEAPTTTLPPADPDQCPAMDVSRLPSVRSPSDASREGSRQQELMGDIERARQYGQAIPEEFNEVWLDYFDGQWIVAVGFKSRVDVHRAALLARVEHSDRLLVCRSTRSLADRQQIMAELGAIANSREVFSAYDVGIDRTSVNLRADQEMLAKELYDKYSPSIDITVGLFPYPPASAGTVNVECPTIDAVAAPSGLRITAEPASTSFASGTGPRTTVRIHNSSATRYAGSQGSIYLVRAGTLAVVGLFAGPRDLALRGFDTAPGGEGGFDDVFGTAPCAWGGGYTLPKGTYEVLPTVNVNGIGLVVGEPTRVILT